MSHRKKIRTPIKQHIRMFRQRQLPLFIWVAATALVVALAQRQAVRVDAVGIAKARNVAVSSPVSGTVKSLFFDVYEPVKAGDIVATLDNTLITAELNTVKTEIPRLQAAIEAEEARLESDFRAREQNLQAERRRFAWNLECASLDLLDRKVAVEVDRVEYQRLTIIFERLARLVQENAGRQADLDEARMAREVVATRIKHNVQAVKEATRLKEAAEARLRELPASPPAARVQTLLEPLRSAVQVQQARLEELILRRESLILRAPIDGVISRIRIKAGEAAAAGATIFSISNPRSTFVVAHINEDSRRMNIKPGDTVEVLRRTHPIQMMEAKVMRVGPSVLEIPAQIRRKPDILEWGRPILIAAAELNLIPGETVDVRLPAQAQSDIE